MNFARRLELVLSEYMGAAEYRPPRQPRQLMADFYTLQLLEAGGPRYVPSHHREELQHELQRVAHQLIPYLRQHLLLAAGYSIACELRHLFDEAAPIDDEERDDEVSWQELRLRALRALQDQGVDAETARVLQMLAYDDDRPSREGRFQDLDTLRRLARAGLAVFADWGWSEGYGGEPWRSACETWLQLYRAQSLPDTAIYIDKLYSCEHNSGALLDKNPEYDSDWVQSLLDLKFQAREPEDLLPYASPYLRRLGLAVMRDQHGRGWDRTPDPGRMADVPNGDQAGLMAAGLESLLRRHFTRVKQLASTDRPDRDIRWYCELLGKKVMVTCDMLVRLNRYRVYLRLYRDGITRKFERSIMLPNVLRQVDQFLRRQLPRPAAGIRDVEEGVARAGGVPGEASWWLR